MAKLLLTDSYFKTFNLLVGELKNVNTDGAENNLIFCEEKISLMTERAICDKFGGSFFTEVYSFGNYLRLNKNFDNLLTKEGSSMVVRRLLKDLKLKRFKQSQSNLAVKLFELIALLKSSNVSPKEIEQVLDNCKSILKDKLLDVNAVYSAYEKFLTENGYEDQSSALSHLAGVLEQKDLSNTNVYLLGYAGFTLQQREIIKVLLKKSKSVTAILTAGENKFAFLNETKEIFIDLCKQTATPLDITTDKTEYGEEQAVIKDCLFSPRAFKLEQKPSNTIYFSADSNLYEEVQRVAETIKKHVMAGYRYYDFSIAVPDLNEYADTIKEVFSALEIPFYLDQKTIPNSHPLVKLVLSYIDCKRKNYQREHLTAFFKNPLVCTDKNLLDDFENYLLAQNVDYNRIFTPFNAQTEGYYEELEKFRAYLTDLLQGFSVIKLLASLDCENKLIEFSSQIKQKGENTHASLNEQIYSSVIKILEQMHALLNDEDDLLEYKNIFLNGVGALELSLLPQYSDAVFIGGYREVALIQNKKIFYIGLTSSVPNLQEDTAILSDSDISALSEFSCLIEPKIRIINHRIRENVAMAFCSYLEDAYLSYPVNTSGGKSSKSEILGYLEKAFAFKKAPEIEGYLTKKQAIYNFSKDCGEFIKGSGDMIKASSFYSLANKTDSEQSQKLKNLLESANQTIKIRLNNNTEVLVKNVISPTYIEDYYSCPYQAFAKHGLGLKVREKGEMNALAVGNLMHEIFCEYLKNISKVGDENSLNQLFEQIKNQVIQREEYSRFYAQAQSGVGLDEALLECKKFCDKLYQVACDSEFTTEFAEVQFGDGKDFPPIELLDGQVKIKGKIDRVDTYGDYFRIIDYKTGTVDASEKNLYAGVKMQLYLYSAVLKDKKLAGLYYLPINDKYKGEDEKEALLVGKTLNEEQVLIAQDKTLKDNAKSKWLECEKTEKGVKKAVEERILSAMVDYALKMSEQAVKQMKDGVIVPSAYEKACEYCEFKGLCQNSKLFERKVRAISPEEIYHAVNGGENE